MEESGSTAGGSGDGAAEGGWSNWAGSVHCRPARIEAPSSAAEVEQCIARARAEGLTVRVVGTGHSFTPIVATDGVLLTLDHHAGIEEIDVAERRARIRGGTKLHAVGEPLLDAGLAMANLGDVDVQSIGGALGTGTHGTGPTLRNLPSQLVELTLATADGGSRTLRADEHPEELRAARVSLGALGVTTSATLQLVPAYRLHERVGRPSIEECLEGLAEAIASHRHFEFFWYPARDLVETKRIDPTDAEPESIAGRRYERIDWSSRILPSERTLRFHEMEYSLPADRGRECFERVRSHMLQHHPEVQWPVEYRTLGSDDAMLSTASGRETVTISIHQDARLPHRELFADIEPLFWEYGGRPHWGKVHRLGARELRDLYPSWDRFQEIRTEFDPEGRFLNEALRALFLD